MSFGIEYFPHLEAIDSEIEDISHFQVSIPTQNQFSAYFGLSKPIIVHSNLLNAMGSNDWSILGKYKNTIKELKPIAIIEHATSIHSSTSKNAITINNWCPETLKENVLRWQDMLNIEVILENPPTDDISKILDLLEFTIKNDIQFACDIPHLIMSTLSSGMSKNEFISLLQYWNPNHRHIGGIRIKDNYIFDEHNKIDMWMLDFVNQYLGEGYTTLEQSPHFDSRAIKNNILKSRSIFEPILESIFTENRKIMNEELYNNLLAKNRAEAFGFKKFSRTLTEKIPKEFETYNYINPFYDLFNSVNICLESATSEEITEIYTRVFNFCIGIDSWINAKNKYFIEYYSTDIQFLVDLSTETQIVELIKKDIIFIKHAIDGAILSFGVYN